MSAVLASSWALLLGVFLLMIGNGIQGSLLGMRGALEGFTTSQMSLVMSGYFIGILAGSRLVPALLLRVGHIRVFGALAGLVSATLLLYALLPYTPAWFLLRVTIGFAFCGVYITTESWLNSAVENAYRGRAMSLYVLAQMAGIITSQGIQYTGDPAGPMLFLTVAVLASLAAVPLLISARRSPAFAEASPLPLGKLFRLLPLSAVGTFLLGGVFAAQFGMVGVWGTHAGLSLGQLSFYVAMVYFGAMIVQPPLGWIADRMDRRRLIVILAIGGLGAGLLGSFAGTSYPLQVASGFLLGAVANSLYAVLMAYANDALTPAQMPSASAGFLLVSAMGSIFGPLTTGWLMESLGTWAYFLFMGVLLGLLAPYAIWRLVWRDSRAGLTSHLAPH